jgi:uncharacterized protein
MQYTQIDTTNFAIRIVRGEKIVGSLASFAKKHNIEGGFFYGLGAVDEAEVAHYDVGSKKYSSKKYKQAFEVTNISGSIGIDKENGNIIVHAHITLSDTDMNAFGGHLVEARVSGTIELYLTTTPRMEKVYDEETGLKLLDF